MPNEDPKSTWVGSQPKGAAPPQGQLDLNQASEAEIAEIDMIGKKLAHALVERRAERGGFHDWDELKDVPGLNAMKIAELQRAARLGGGPS